MNNLGGSLDTGSRHMKAMVRKAKAYDTFTGKDAHTDGSVAFVVQTDGSSSRKQHLSLQSGRSGPQLHSAAIAGRIRTAGRPVATRVSRPPGNRRRLRGTVRWKE